MTAPLINRRTILRGLGASVALPWLEAMGPLTSWAAGTSAAQAAPNRVARILVSVRWENPAGTAQSIAIETMRAGSPHCSYGPRWSVGIVLGARSAHSASEAASANCATAVSWSALIPPAKKLSKRFLAKTPMSS